MDISLQLIVFLPLIAALIAGLGGRWIGATAAKVVTTGALLVGAALSWPILFDFLSGNARPMVIDVAEWIKSGDMDVTWALRVDTLTAVMLVVVTTTSMTAVSASTRSDHATWRSPELIQLSIGTTSALASPAM